MKNLGQKFAFYVIVILTYFWRVYAFSGPHFASRGANNCWRGLPDCATSSTGLPCSCDMNPMTEKITNPENKLVQLLMHEMMNASLYIDNHTVTIFGRLQCCNKYHCGSV